jgi:hypothetical protein
MIGGKRRLYPGDVYAAGRRSVNPLPIASDGQVLSASKARLIAHLTGTEPVGVGEPDDGLRGGQAIADFLNTFTDLIGRFAARSKAPPPHSKTAAGPWKAPELSSGESLYQRRRAPC